MRTLTTCLLILFSFSFLAAQYSSNLVPRVSSDNSISERVAYTEIAINYGSPKVKGREIWGDMEHYGEIWRAGANSATTISFSEDVKVGGKALARGTYSFFVIPEENKAWTVIFNKAAKQWGAFNYDPAEDAARIKVKPIINTHVEDLTFDIIAKDFEGAYVTLEWEKVKLSFFVAVEHLDILEKLLAEKLAEIPPNARWVTYLQAANYLVDNEERLSVAQDWLDKSDALYAEKIEWSGQYYPKAYVYGDLLWVKAKLAAAQGKYRKAIEFAMEMQNIAGDYVFYKKENASERIDERVALWKSME